MPPLQQAIVGCHLLLAATLAAGLLLPLSTMRVAATVVLALPLLLTLRGLVQGRRTTLQRLAVLLVAYVGGLSVEVVASEGEIYAFAVALLAAGLELGLLLAFIRRSALRRPEARE